jgi:hypothetical protein
MRPLLRALSYHSIIQSSLSTLSLAILLLPVSYKSTGLKTKSRGQLNILEIVPFVISAKTNVLVGRRFCYARD